MSFQMLLVGLAFMGGVAANLCIPRGSRWKGRHISRPLVRRLGPARARSLWRNLVLLRLATLIYGIWSGSFWPWVALVVIEVARDVDDWLYSDDDDDRREDRFRARVRLRMPKPIRLRPVERVGAAA